MIPIGNQGIGTLDQEVDTRADNMRLKGQTSTVSKDLLDVMASQRVAREKEMALKDLQASQETNPATIKEQLENQVMGMTQNEMTAQTAGILANRRPTQQQRPPQSTPMMGKNPSLAINRGAPQGGIANARPPMGSMPQSGIAGAARPPMMASGGIVGFSAGGLNSPDAIRDYQASKGGRRVEALTEALKRRGLTRKQFEALSPAEKQEIRATLPQIMQELQQGRDNYMSPAQRLKDATNPQALAEKRENAQKQLLKKNNPALFAERYPDEVKPNTADLDTSALGTNNIARPKISDMKGKGILRPGQQFSSDTTPTPTSTPTPATGDDAFTSRTTTTTGPASAGFDVTKAVTDLKTDPSITEEQQAQLDKSKTLISDTMPQKMKDAITEGAGVDIGAKETDLQTKFDERYLPTELKDGKPQDGSLQGLKALQEQQQKVLDYQATPEYQRKLRVQQSLGRGASFAGAGKAELEAANNAITNYKDVMKTRLDALKTSDESVNNALTRIQTSRDKMLNLQLNMTAEDRKAYMAEKDQFLKKNEAFITAELKKLGIISQDQLKRSVETAQDKGELYALLKGIAEAREKLREEELKLVAAKIITLEGSKDPEDKAELRRIKDEARDNAAVAFLAEEDIIIAAIESMPGGGALADAFRAGKDAKRKARDGGAGGAEIQNSTGASQSSLSYIP